MADPNAPLQAHIDAVAPPGTAAYLALLFCPGAGRQAVGALLALSHELDALGGKNPETAAFRLNWWAEELERLGNGRPSHPITRELLACGLNDERAMGRLSDRFVAASSDVAGTTHADLEALEAHLERGHGATQWLVARALDSDPDDFPGYAADLGVALGLCRTLATAPRDGAAGRVPLPAALLEAHGVTLTELKGNTGSTPLRALAERLAERIDDRLDRAGHALPVAERPRQRAGLVLGALHRRVAHRLTTEPPDRWLATLQLGGPAALWTAWRTARRAARGKL